MSRLITFVKVIVLFSTLYIPLLFASEPPENVRVEDGLLQWDPVEGAISYNIYATSLLENGNGYYVETVVDDTHFQPRFTAYYTVIAYYGGSPEVFSNFHAGEFVRWGADPLLSGSEIAALLRPVASVVDRDSEVRTNRCTEPAVGQGCAVMCDSDNSWFATGGACRADTPVVLHQRAKYDGYECTPMAETAFVEVDVVCLRGNR